MQTLTVARTLDAPRAAVWNVLADFGNVAAWNPNLAASHLLTEGQTGIGTTRHCQLKDGKNYIRERIALFEEQRAMQLDVVDGTMPFRRATIVVELEDHADAQTLVTFRMEFEPKGGPLGALAANVAMKPMLRRLFGRLFDGLQAHLNQELRATA